MLKPLGNRVLLELVEEETTTPSGIVLPDSAKEKPQFATVVAVGEGKILIVANVYLLSKCWRQSSFENIQAVK